MAEDSRNPDAVPTAADLWLKKGARKKARSNAPAMPSLFGEALFGEALFAEEPPAVIVEKKSALAPVANVADREGFEPPTPPPAPEPAVFSVSQLISRVRGLVENRFGSVTVEGEISNWRPATSGHCYFTLKDNGAQLQIVMFRREAMRVKFRPKDGDAVRITGSLSIYEARGQMQMVAERMEQVGLGAMLEAVRQLKERLRREGLFDRQRPLPAFPRCIGIVTSLQGAALRDIVKVCRRRHAAVNLLVYHAAVQGPNCPAEVAAGVRWFSAHPERVDVVLVARGGGSWEDLHGFDAEEVARAIAACSVPVITGIGHAPDCVIADAAADVCAPTPSAAAELLTAAQHRVEEQVDRLTQRLQRASRYELLRARQRFAGLGEQRLVGRIEDLLRRRAQRVDELDYRAENAVQQRVRKQHSQLDRLEATLRRHHPALKLAGDRSRLEALTARLEQQRAKMIDQRQTQLDRAALRLGALSPLAVLERGYSLVYTSEGKLVRKAAQLHSGQGIVARFGEGRVRARVEYSE
ncbi:exodeoxyribonuclease VII large subunit [Granulicella cerasi]|uniref:Exodeoxyribonuclease 7 large subunit n=1 Tax=Granulicella cerasi TaxID=741063 RepID=A0ABW1ZBC5_9BACT|nr:exodeoxyribonuclease VII large subunit [Granulicella cerasi]